MKDRRERDEAITAELLAGETGSVVARRYHLSNARVYQIRDKVLRRRAQKDHPFAGLSVRALHMMFGASGTLHDNTGLLPSALAFEPEANYREVAQRIHSMTDEECLRPYMAGRVTLAEIRAWVAKVLEARSYG